MEKYAMEKYAEAGAAQARELINYELIAEKTAEILTASFEKVSEEEFDEKYGASFEFGKIAGEYQKVGFEEGFMEGRDSGYYDTVKVAAAALNVDPNELDYAIRKYAGEEPTQDDVDGAAIAAEAANQELQHHYGPEAVKNNPELRKVVVEAAKNIGDNVAQQAKEQ